MHFSSSVKLFESFWNIEENQRVDESSTKIKILG